jgi:mono/diheme cytochrome c family protein
VNRSIVDIAIFGVASVALAGVTVPPVRADDDLDPNSGRPTAESFVLHCSGCHRVDGSGVPGIAPDLRQIGALLDSTGGRDYLGRVPGVAQAPLDDTELAALLNWVLIEIAGRTPEPMYDASEIAALRARPLRDPIAARRALPIR